jgi:sugar phosphate isomerase/epimerase
MSVAVNNSMYMNQKSCLTLIILAAGGLALGAPEPNAPAPKANPFFAFCMDTHDAKKRTLEQQAEMLKELGYDGAGHLWLDKIPERLKTLDAAGLKLFQITMSVNIAPDKPAYDARFNEVLPLLKGRGVQFVLLMNGLKPSDQAGDARAVEVVREMASLAAESGAQILLYPHTGFWLERLEDSVRVADKVDRPNVGVMFNLCHWLRVSKDRDYLPLLKKAMPRLAAISINGADEFDAQPGWQHYIQPLGRGSFDVFRFLKDLRQLGYTGPVGLQCFGIPGDARDGLAESMKAWRSYSARLGDGK